MLKTMYVHIGHNKTGTTSVQRTFFNNVSVLKKHGVFYYANKSSHHAIANHLHAKTAGQKNVGRIFKNFIQAHQRTNLPVALFSSEVMVRLTADEVKTAIEHFAALADEVKVLCYVRNPVAFAVSAAHQGVRLGRRLRTIENRPNANIFAPKLKWWSDAVGRDNMIVRAYDRPQLVNGDIVDDVLDVMGLIDIAPSLQRSTANEGLSVLAIHLIDAMNGLGEANPLRQTHIRSLGAVGGPKYVLPKRSIEKARERTAQDLAALEKDWGLSLPEPELVPSPPLSLSEAELSSLAAALGEILHRSPSKKERTASPAAAPVAAPVAAAPSATVEQVEKASFWKALGKGFGRSR